MLKFGVSYTGFDDVQHDEELYFNISKTELADNIDLKDEFEALEETFTGPTRDLTPAEVKQILDLVKRFIKIGYGERSEDGRRFHKSEESFNDFVDRGAHDEFVWSLFKNSDNAVEFLLGVLPKDLREEAQTIAGEKHPELFVDTVDVHLPEDRSEPEGVLVETGEWGSDGHPVQEDPRPNWMKEDREPTSEELQRMDKDELLLAMRRKYKNVNGI